MTWKTKLAILFVASAVFVGWLLAYDADAAVRKGPLVVRSSAILTGELPLRVPAGEAISRPVFRLTAQLQEGLSYGLSGTLQTTTPYLGSLQAQVLYCDSEGSSGAYSAWSTTNHLGEENGAAPGTVAQTAGQWLFTVPTTGLYTCTLYGRAGRNPYPDGWPTQSLTVVGGSICIDLVPRTGTEWRQPDIVKIGGENGESKWVLVKKWESLTSADIRVRTETQLSSISIGQSTVATADISTYVTQLTAAGQKCSRSISTTRFAIPSKLHHLKIGQTILMNNNPACSNRWAIQVLVTYVSGQGMQVEGPSYTSAHIHNWSVS